MLGVGATKAALAYQGNLTAPNTLDWILGLLWALVYVSRVVINHRH